MLGFGFGSGYMCWIWFWVLFLGWVCGAGLEAERNRTLDWLPRMPDLFAPTLQMFAHSEARLSINGVHLDEDGHHRLAEILASSLFGSSAALGLKDEPLRAAVRDTNWHWHQR